MTRALLYARQSIEKDEGERSLSLDSQITALSDRCQREGWAVVGIIRESGLKGYMDVDERPGMAEAIARAEHGDYDTLLVWDLSRLARSLRLQEQWVWQFDRLGVSVISHTEPHATDTLLRQITGAISEHRTREIAGHVRRALRERTRRGVPHGSAPYGYARVPRSENEPIILAPNDDAETVRRIFQWRAEGQSLGEIIAQLRCDGIPGPTGGPWYRPTLTHILSNPVYCGTLHLAEIVVQNAHASIVDEELWRKVQHVGSSRSRWPRTKTTRSWLEGLIEHACGNPMYLVGGSTGFPVPTFRCRVGGGWGQSDAVCMFPPRQIAADRAEALTWDAVTETFARLPLSPKAIIKAAQAEYRRLTPDTDAAMRMAQERQKRAATKRERLIDLYIRGDIDRAKFDREPLLASNEGAEANLVLAGLPDPPDPTLIESAWQLLRDMRRSLIQVPEEERGLWLRKVGVAVLSPAGHTIVTGRRGPRPDAGVITIRFRSEYAQILGKTDSN